MEPSLARPHYYLEQPATTSSPVIIFGFPMRIKCNSTVDKTD